MEPVSQEAGPPAEPRERTSSSRSSHSSKLNFAPTTSDSGLYTCSSSNSECPESDSDCFPAQTPVARDEAFQLALAEGRRLRSELERLRKSEQWYKHEMRQQRATRLEDLEKIYTQERKFIRENQRLQQELMQLYERCGQLERQMEEQRCQMVQESPKRNVQHSEDEGNQLLHDQQQQQSGIIEEQRLLIEVLRQQKKSLLEDLKCLTEEKDRKITELQRLLAGLEIDHKQIVKKCKNLSQERSHLEQSLTQANEKISAALEDNLHAHKTVVELREQLDAQEELVRLKEAEIAQLAERFRSEMNSEQDLDEVHRLSMNYHEDISQKTAEIVSLKTQLSAMQCELEGLQDLQAQSDQQQRHIEQLQFCLDVSQAERAEICQSDGLKTSQINKLKAEVDKLLHDNQAQHQQQLDKQQQLTHIRQQLKTTEAQHARLQAEYKDTRFKLQMLEIDYKKLTFQRGNDQREIALLRQKLKEYLQQTAELSERMKVLEQALQQTLQENVSLRADSHCVRELNRGQEDVEEEIGRHDTQCRLHTSNVRDAHLRPDIEEGNRNVTDITAQFAAVVELGAATDICEEHLGEMDGKVVGQILNATKSSDLGVGDGGLQNVVLAQKHQIQILHAKLLKTDAKLYKIERRYQRMWEAGESGAKELPDTGRDSEIQTDVAVYEQDRGENKEVQCDLGACQENHDGLRLQLEDLRERVQQGLERESAAKQEKVLLLKNLSEMQSSKMQLLKANQDDWEDMLRSLQELHAMEAETRKELELKRMELEDLNRVFRQQNDQLRRLEQIAAEAQANGGGGELCQKEQSLQEELKLLTRELEQCRAESEERLQLNRMLQEENAQLQQMSEGNSASEMVQYANEIRRLKEGAKTSAEEKQQMIQRLMELEGEVSEVQSRAADQTLANVAGAAGGDVDLRILTRVLESEYERKMQRYNQHIHSLLTNVHGLKKSLKQNEERTAALTEEQCRMQQQLKSLQRFKTLYEDMCCKYEKSQRTIQELKDALALERTRYEASDLGKSLQSHASSSYEASNLIDDYKKLIQQSSSATKRPSTSAILELIQRSNQCQPSLGKLEGSIGDLRCDMQTLLAAVAQRLPSACLLNAASLSVPPTLMDELRAAAADF